MPSLRVFLKVLSPIALATAALLVPAGSVASLTTARHTSRHGSPSLPVSRQSTSSSNWAGYVATGGKFTDVVGSWTQPPASCSGKASYATFWVGFDGFLTNDKRAVEQVGTDSDCTQSKGKKHPGGSYYFAWWDVYPQTFQAFPTSSCPVSAGDSMTAEVSSSNGSIDFTITDSTRGWQCTASQTLSEPGLSAEWIVEAPTVGGSKKVLPLANFGSVDFTNVMANGTSISALASAAISMQAGSTTKASTSGLGSDGASFTVTWMHS